MKKLNIIGLLLIASWNLYAEECSTLTETTVEGRVLVRETPEINPATLGRGDKVAFALITGRVLDLFPRWTMYSGQIINIDLETQMARVREIYGRTSPEMDVRLEDIFPTVNCVHYISDSKNEVYRVGQLVSIRHPRNPAGPRREMRIDGLFKGGMARLIYPTPYSGQVGRNAIYRPVTSVRIENE